MLICLVFIFRFLVAFRKYLVLFGLITNELIFHFDCVPSLPFNTHRTGVGKTSLTHLIANNEALTAPGWTVGCAVEVKLHEYKEGTPSQRTHFVELWDVGGSISHRNTRGVFYQSVHGIVLVHDLTNRRSHENLQSWIGEIVNRERDGKDVNRSVSVQSPAASTSLLMDSTTEFDPEQFLGVTQVADIARLDNLFARCA